MTKEKHSFKPPELPPVPNPVNPPADANNWLWRHHNVNNGVNDHEHKPDEFDPIPAPLTANVTSDNPLVVDVFDSIRSPYSYLVINRLAYLQSNYNCKVTMRVIFPGAIRMPDVAGGGVDEFGHQIVQEQAQKTHYKQGGRWYKWADCVWDCYRVAQFQGIPWKFANPDPIDQNHYPFLGLDYGPSPHHREPDLDLMDGTPCQCRSVDRQVHGVPALHGPADLGWPVRFLARRHPYGVE